MGGGTYPTPGEISGPLLDRIDLQVEVQPVNFEQMPSKQPGEPSSAIRERVIKARAIQSLRFKNHPGVHCNAQMTTALLHKYAEPDAEGMEKLREAITKMNMSARAYDRILKVARTIADLGVKRHRPPAPHHGSHRLPQPRQQQLF